LGKGRVRKGEGA